MNILVVNAGSSSLKLGVTSFDSDRNSDRSPPSSADSDPSPFTPCWSCILESAHGTSEATVKISRSGSGSENSSIAKRSLTLHGTPTELIRQTMALLWSGENPPLSSPEAIDIIGHRIVHGGSDLRQTTPLTPDVEKQLTQLVPLAPLHLPPALEAIGQSRTLAQHDPLHVAVFDTSFHRTLPPEAAHYPIPNDWYEKGIRRYGFHGINHEYCALRAAAMLGRPLRDLRIVTCHLGNGCSLAAVAEGESRDTTMGFTPLDGLMMGSRPGSLDPGVLVALLRRGMNVDELEAMLQQNCGLKGVSGISGDMRDIIAALQSGDSRARLAREMFLRKLIASIAGFAVLLGRLDALVFSGGIGEHDTELRSRVCSALGMLGVEIDADRNALASTSSTNPDTDITARKSGSETRTVSRTGARSCSSESPTSVLVIGANEEALIARECFRLLQESHS